MGCLGANTASTRGARGVRRATGVPSLLIGLVEVTSIEDAGGQRFLGSPSIRVDGHDVEPGADERDLCARVSRLSHSVGVERSTCGRVGTGGATQAAAGT